MWLTGEAKLCGWWMTVDRERLLAAIEAGVGPDHMKARRGRSAATLTLVVCERGLSVRSRTGGRDVPALGAWASPIVVSAARLRSQVAGLPGPDVHVEYSDGRLWVDWKTMKAREL